MRWVLVTNVRVSVYMYSYFFFFSSRRRHTRYWRDWSSDVCSSDLRERKVPFFGICLGMQMACIEAARNTAGIEGASSTRSEERRVGKECRSRWSPDH